MLLEPIAEMIKLPTNNLQLQLGEIFRKIIIVVESSDETFCTKSVLSKNILKLDEGIARLESF